jgi:hypothetical protein
MTSPDPSQQGEMPAVMMCAIHGVHESFAANGASIQCFECGHVYWDEAAIDAEARNLADKLNATHEDFWGRKAKPDEVVTVDVHNISYCPLCLHDW